MRDWRLPRLRFRPQPALLGLLLLPALLVPPAARPPAGPGAPPVPPTAPIEAAYGKLPLHFEPNQGQADPQVEFLVRGPGYTLFLTPTEAVLALRKPHKDSLAPASGERERVRGPTPAVTEPSGAVVVRTQLVGANAKPQVMGLDELPGKVNYFLGNDPTKWHTNVPTYAKVHYKDIYPGVDLLYYGNQRQVEFDFVVAPGADPTAIRLAFTGAQKLRTDTQGDLIVRTARGQLRMHKPRIYQEVNGLRQEISGGYVLNPQAAATNPQSEIRNPELSVVGFQVAAYDPSKPLIIDPVLGYSTYLGGNSMESGSGIALDAAGNAYVTGSTSSTNFPTTPGAFQPTLGGSHDAFVTKLNPAGSALVYSTYLGGNGADGGSGIALDAAGNAYVTGYALSTNFPTTPGAFQPTGGHDAFVTKLNPAGSALVYSTYLGGNSGEDCGSGIALDAAGNAYVTGETSSTNFPTTPGAFQPSHGGHDAFVTKLNPAGSALVYSTYLGGSSGEDFSSDIAVDAAGNAYVTGETSSTNFPTTPGAFQPSHGGSRDDAFVTKLNLATGPGVGLGLNQLAFRRGESLTLAATVMPGPAPVTADVYVAVRLPDGTLLFLQGDGSFTLNIQPIVRSWPVSPFSGAEPTGSYAWLGAFTEPGTLTFISSIASAPFSFSP